MRLWTVEQFYSVCKEHNFTVISDNFYLDNVIKDKDKIVVLQESKHVVRCSNPHTNKDLFLAQTENDSAVAIAKNSQAFCKIKETIIFIRILLH